MGKDGEFLDCTSATLCARGGDIGHVYDKGYSGMRHLLHLLVLLVVKHLNDMRNHNTAVVQRELRHGTADHIFRNIFYDPFPK